MSRYLSLSALALTFPLWAQAPVQELEPVTVTADPFGGRETLESTQPASVLSGADLDRHAGATMGETLSHQPGVHAADFGAGSSRPVIRGLGGPRIRVLEGGTGVFDASAISPDHNAASEPLRAGQIEVLRGPATLLYGSGAIGGVVNVVTDLIPTAPTYGVSGDLGAHGTTVNDGESYWGHLSAGSGSLGLHLDGMGRSTEDYSIPGTADADGDPSGGVGSVLNTALDTDSFGIGAGWTHADGHFGLGVTRYSTLYGVPGHAHEEDTGTEPSPVEGHDEEPGVRIDLTHTRYELSGDWRQPFAAFERVRGAASYSEYEHRELEGEPAQTGTTFGNEAAELRLEFTHLPLAGSRGVFGTQFIQQEFSALGDEAFVPPVDTANTGVFVVEERQFGTTRASVGLRAEAVEHQPSGDHPDREFELVTLSGGLHVPLPHAHHLNLNLTRAQRAPDVQELYAFGPHLATLSYEYGNADLSRETALNLDFGVHGEWRRLGYTLNLFHTRYDRFIYAAEVDEDGQPGADRVDEEGAPAADGELLVLRTVQDDARFTGAEAELTADLVDSDAFALDLRLFGDWVRARLKGGATLPRTPPHRLGLALTGQRGSVGFGTDVVRVGRQSDTADLESATAGYTLVGAHVDWTVYSDSGEFRVSVAGTNLLDEVARNHVSVLKDLAPLPGRGARMAIEYRF